MNWFPLPNRAIDLRSDTEGWFWRHQERIPHPEGEGPYPDAETAATAGTDHANFVNGT